VALRQSTRHAGISGDDKADRSCTRVVAVWVGNAESLEIRDAVGGQLAGEYGRGLARTEGLIAQALVKNRLVEFPTQPIIQSEIRLDLPTVLGKQINRIPAHIFRLR